MLRLVFITLILLFAGSGYAQHTDMIKGKGSVSGHVVEANTSAPLEYATITVFDKALGQPVTGTTSNKNGEFTVADIKPGSYRILVEFIGFKPFEISSVTIIKNETIRLKTISLDRLSQNLSAVTVTGTKLIENKIDKLVFNAEKDITSAGGVATDILKKIPLVSVDIDGNVQLAGSSGVRFLINGKPSTAFGAKIADVLQSLPASQIKSVEVITNPGAKYDAQGFGGIINIILKSNTAQGINGNLSLTAGTRADNGTFNFNARNKNFGINAFVSGNTRPVVNTSYYNQRNSIDSLNSINSILIQDGITRVKKYGDKSGLGLDWTYKKKNNFTGTINYNLFGNSNQGQINQLLQIFDHASTATAASINNTVNKNRTQNIFTSFNYKRRFNKEDQELEFSVNSSSEQFQPTTINEQRLLQPDSLFYGVQSTNHGRESETQIALDYTQPLGDKVNWGMGMKTTFLDISSQSDVSSYRPVDKLYQYDSALSTSLQYHQKVYALYTEFTFPVAKLFDVKAGSRYERTEINSDYSNAPQHVRNPGYNTLVPSLFLSKKLGNKQVIKLSYSKRIERPDYGDLNPYINVSDPKNISGGNPFLLPELGQRIEFGYSREIGNLGSIMATAFFRHNSNDIQPYVKFYPSFKVGDSIYYNVSLSTRENIGVENNTGVNLFADLHPTSRLTLRTNFYVFHRKIYNYIDVGADRTSFNYKVNLNATYQFTRLLAAEFFGNFSSARNEVQGKYPSFTTYSFALRKLFWNKKASLAFTTNNPFSEYVIQKTELYGTNFTALNQRKIPYRSFGLNFTWKFGLLEFKKERENNNDDTQQ